MSPPDLVQVRYVIKVGEGVYCAGPEFDHCQRWVLATQDQIPRTNQAPVVS